MQYAPSVPRITGFFASCMVAMVWCSAAAFAGTAATSNTQVGDTVTNPVTNLDTTVVALIKDSSGVTVFVVTADNKTLLTQTAVGDIIRKSDGGTPPTFNEYVVVATTVNATSALVESVDVRLVSAPESDPVESLQVVAATSGSVTFPPPSAGPSIPGVIPPTSTSGVIYYVVTGSSGGRGSDGGGVEICDPFFGSGCVFLGVEPAEGGDGEEPAAFSREILSSYNGGSPIESTANATPGITVGSVGGDGGVGGRGFVCCADGAAGGDGGSGGDVTVTNSAVINVDGDDSYGLYVYSVAGTAGAGGDSVGLVGSGGSGGAAQSGGTVVAINNALITTSGDSGHAIRAFSSGGAAGAGGGAVAFVGGSGNGAVGGNGGVVRVNNFGVLRTDGNQASGILAQSQGGVGGDSGVTVGLIVAVGGAGSGGGDAASVVVRNEGAITTVGNDAKGIQAMSTGGGGGTGLGAGGLVALSGAGGKAGVGGAVTVFNSGDITTAGASADAIFAQSVGGSGGVGGSAGGLVASGAGGGGAGDSGDVYVLNSGALVTRGNASRGIFAQSIAGGGGTGGGSGGLVALAGSGGGAGDAGRVTVVNFGSITTGVLGASGYESDAIFAQSIGGGGGVGAAVGGLVAVPGAGGGGEGDGGAVYVSNYGLLQTLGLQAAGIYAQSVGGGGGSGGGAGGLVALGGQGGEASDGGLVDVDNKGDIRTFGSASDAIFAQSVGGAGGRGAAAGGLVASSTAGGGAGNSGTVTVTNAGNLQTSGTGSKGIYAQSIGGGGGTGGESGGLVAVSGIGGGAGFAEAVTVKNSGQILTGVAGVAGKKESSAIYAQSVGGGGGDGAPSGGLVAVPGSAGGGEGKGGAVDVFNSGFLRTYYDESFGIFAQSVGGGGGNGGGSGGLVALGGQGGGSADGDTVDVENTGAIETYGSASDAIFAQSIGGGGGRGAAAGGLVAVSTAGGGAGNSGTVTVTNSGNLQTSGTGSKGIFAQSIGGGGGAGGEAGGLVAVSGGGGGAGDGSDVTVTNTGSITTTGAVLPKSSETYTFTTLEDDQDCLSTIDCELLYRIKILEGEITVPLEDDDFFALQTIDSDTIEVIIYSNTASASAIYAQSVGGGGGAGTASGGGVAVSGGGGGAGDGGDVDVTNSRALSTAGSNSYGIFAQSIGGGGGESAASGGLVAVSGDGAGAGFGGEVTVINSVGGDITTAGVNSTAIFAQSVGGGGGAGDASGGLVAVGGDGGSASYGGNVTVTSDANLITMGASAKGILAQSIGGGGGVGGIGGAIVALGGDGGTGRYGGDVSVTSHGNITTYGRNATGIYAQSIGGGGGTSGDSGALFAWGGAGSGDGLGSLGGKVTVVSNGTIVTHGNGAKGIFAESVGGGGGEGGSAYGLFVTIGGDGGDGSEGGDVDVTHGGLIHTYGISALGLHAQSVGGSGGDGGDSYSGSLFFGYALGGTGGSGALGGNVDVTLGQFLDEVLQSRSMIVTENDRSTGILAQSVGGGGGSGGKSVQASAGAFINMSVSIGGTGGTGSQGGLVNLDGAGDVLTKGDISPGVVLQSVGGGGGNGGSSVSVSFAAGEGISVAGSVAMGGSGGAAGDGGTVTADVDSHIHTQGVNSTGFLAQSVGGGGGNGGNAISAAASFSDGAAGAVGVALGGDGSGGGAGGLVDVDFTGSVITEQAESSGLVIQSIGGGGGNGGTTVAASLGAAGGLGGNFSLALGAGGGGGGDANNVLARIVGDVAVMGNGSDGVVVQSIGGGGGNSGLSVGAGLGFGGAGAAASLNLALGATAGAGGSSGLVNAYYEGILSTLGPSATGILAQSIGGGGGNASGTIAAGLAGSGSAAGTLGVSLGGAGGGGGNGGIAGARTTLATAIGERDYQFAVSLETKGSVSTDGVLSPGVIAQSVGGGGGNGGYSVSGSLSAATDAAGTIGISLGGDGGGGALGMDVLADIQSTVITRQLLSEGVLVQSVGGGGGNGGISVSAGLAGSAGAAGSLNVGIGGSGGIGARGGNINATTSGAIYTRGDQSDGFIAQSIGGGGGNGGGNVSASLNGGGVAGGINIGLGGTGGTGGHGGSVVAATSADVVTYGRQSVGVLAQSVGGGGGNGDFNVSAGLSGAGAANGQIGVGLGGGGGAAGDGGEVSLTVNNNVFTFGGDGSGASLGSDDYLEQLLTAYSDPLGLFPIGENAEAGAVIAQSIGGGGGNGGLNVTASAGGSGVASGAVNFGLGGDGSGGGSGGAVTAAVTGTILTVGNGANGVLAQSIGGGGGNGALNISGTISGASTGNGALTVGLGGSADLGGTGAAVDLAVTGPVTTFGGRSRGVIAQSIGGGGGNGGINVSGTLTGAGTGNGDITVAVGGDGGGGGDSGQVDARVVGDIFTVGDFSDGFIAQTIGGGGGNSALTIGAAISGSGVGNGSAKISLGGSGGTASNSNIVNAYYEGMITTFGRYSGGMLVQSIGGGGGNAGGNVAAGISGAGTGNGDLTVGVGGDGGGAGDGGLAGVALAVTAEARGQIVTRGKNSAAFTAQSIGGGGGTGGYNVSASGSGAGTGAVGVGVGLGGDGFGGGSGKGVDADVSANIWTYADSSGGVLAQSVGGGGGNGGFNVTAIATGAGATGAGNVAVGLGGAGAKGGSAGQVNADATGTIYTAGDNSGGFLAQSVGGGGGNGGFNVSVSVSGSAGVSGAVSVGLGGNGDEGGAAGQVYASTNNVVHTVGKNSAGVVAQSIGGGGGNGSFNVDVSISGAKTGSGSLGVGLGGGGAGGGDGERVEFTVNNDVTTQGSASAGIIAQSLGGGGGNGAFNVSVPLSAAGTGSGAIGVGLGGNGGTASSGGAVIFRGNGNVTTGDAAEFANGNVRGALRATQQYSFVGSGDDDRSTEDAFITSMGERDCDDEAVDCVALVEAAFANGDLFVALAPGEEYEIEVVDSSTVNILIYERKISKGDFSQGIVVQSIGGGGGNGAFDVTAGISGSGKGSGSLSISLGGSGAGGGNGGVVNSIQTGTIQTAGFAANGLTVQSVGGGGGNGNFSVGAALSGAGTGSGAGAISLGGSGAGGGSGASVDSVHTGSVVTLGGNSTGVLVQSIGGGGGNGGFSVAGGLSVAKTNSGALTVGIGGTGGAGGSAGSVTGVQTGNVSTLGNFSPGVVVQSIGGGGGNGGFSVSGNIAAAQSGAGSLGVGVGGTGGAGSYALDATSTVNGLVETVGDYAHGILTQSLGGGGGNGGFNVTGNLTGSKEGSGNLAVGVGGFGGSGGYASAATSVVTGGVLTSGDNSNGVATQSIGGGGGNGAFNVSGSINISTTGAGAALGVGVGGFGGDGADAGVVTSTVTMTQEFDRVATLGRESIGIIAQSVGGGGGSGAMNVTGTLNATSKSGASMGIGLGGFGGGAGDGKAVTLGVTGLIITQGANSHGILAQSVGGGGGNGGTNVTGTIGISKAATASATQVGAAIGIGGFGGNSGAAGDVAVRHDGSIYAGMGARELIAEVVDQETGDVITPAYYVLRNFPGVLVPASREQVLDEQGEPVIGDDGEPQYKIVPEYYEASEDDFGGSGLIAQSIGGGGGAGGVNVSGSITAGFGEKASGYGLVVGVGGFGGAGGDAGIVNVDVTSGGDIVAAGKGRSGVLAQSVGGGGGDGGTNVSGSISTDAPLLVGVGGFGANAGQGKAVTVNVAADIDVLGQGTLADVSDELTNPTDKLDDEERRPDRMSAGIMAQSIGGGGGNGGLNVSGAIVTKKSTGIPAVNVGIGGYGGAGATSDDVTVVHEGSITVVGDYAHGILAQSIGGGGGNGATNVSGQISKASSLEGEAGGNKDISIIVGVGGSGGVGAKSGDVAVTQSGEIITKGDNARGIFAQSISDGGGVGGLNVTALLALKTSPVVVGVGGSGGAGAQAGNVRVVRGNDDTDAGFIITDGESAHGIEASTISGGGGDAGANFAFSAVKANAAEGDGGFSANIGIGGAGGEAADAGTAFVDNNGDIVTRQQESHGIFAQSIGGGGGNANFNIAIGIAKGGAAKEDDDGAKGVGIAIGGATGNGGSGGQVDAFHRGNIDTFGNNSYGVLAQSIGGGGGNVGYDFNAAVLDGAKLGVKLGREGGTGGHGGAVRLDSNGTITTRGKTAYGLLAQSIGNGGGNSSSSKFSFETADTGKGTNNFTLSLGLAGGDAGFGGDVVLNAKGIVVTMGADSRAIFAQSVGGGGGNAGGASTLGATAGSSIALGGEGGEGGYGGKVAVESYADIQTSGNRASGIVAQSLGGGGGTGSKSMSGGYNGTNSGLNISIGGNGGKGNYGGTVDVDNYGVIITKGANAVGVLAQSIGDGGGEGGSAFTGVFKGNETKDPFRLSMAFGGAGGEGGYGSAVSVNNYGGIGTLGYRSVGIFAQSVGGAGGIGGASTVLTASGVQGSQNFSLALGGSGASGAIGGDVTVTNQLAAETGGQISTYGNDAHGIVAMSVGGGGGSAGSSSILNRGASGDKAMSAESLSVAVGGVGGEGGIGGTVDVTNDGIIVTRGDRAHGIYATSVGGGGGAGGSSFIGEFVLGLPKLAGGSASNVQVAVGGAGGAGNLGGNVRVENSGSITVNGEQSYGVYAQSVGGGGGDGGLAIAASKDIVNFKEPVKSLMKFAIGGFGGDANNGGNVDVVHTGTINVNGRNSIGIFAESIGGAGGNAGTSISSPVWMAGDLLLQLAVGGSGSGQAGNVNVQYTGDINIAETAIGSQGVVIQKVSGGGGNSNFYYDMSQQARELGEGGYDLPDNSGFKDQVFAYIEGTLKAGAAAIGLGDVDVDLDNLAPTGFDVDGSIFGSAANGLGSITQSVSGGGGRSVTTLVVQQDGSESSTDEVDLVTDDAFLDEETRALLNRYAAGEDLSDVDPTGILKDSFAARVGQRSGATVDLLAELGGTGVSGASSGDVEFSQTGSLVMLGEDSQGAIVQSIGGGGGQMEVRIYSSPEVPNPAPAAPQPIAAAFSIAPASTQPLVAPFSIVSAEPQPSFAVFSSEPVVSPATNYRVLDAQLGTIRGTENNAGKVTVSRSGVTVTSGDFSPGFVSQSIGGGGGQLSVTGMDVLFVSMGGTDGATGDGDDVLFSNDGDIYTQGQLSHGVVVQSIGGGGGSVVSDTRSENVFVVRNSDNTGNGGAVSYSQSGFVVTEGQGAYGVVLQSLGGGGGIVDNLFLGSAGGAGTADDVRLTLKGSTTVGGQGGIALIAQSEARDGAGDVEIDVSGTVTAAGNFSTGVLGITRSSAGSGDLLIQVGGDVIASGTSAVGLMAVSESENTSGAVSVSVGGDLYVEGRSSKAMSLVSRSFGGASANVTSTIGGKVQGNGAGLTLLELVSEGGTSAGNLSITLIDTLQILGEDATSLLVTSAGKDSGGAISVQTKSLLLAGERSSAVVAESIGEQRSGAVTIDIGGDVNVSGPDSIAITARSISGGSAGDITINTEAGASIYAGVNGTGVFMDGGNDNLLSLRAPLFTADGLQGTGIRATSGNDRVVSEDYFMGQFDLGGGRNEFVNRSGSTLVLGPQLAVGGVDSVLLNEGAMMLGGMLLAQSTVLQGSFAQGSTGISYVELDFETDTLDQLLATGNAMLGGEVHLYLLNPALIPSGEFSRALFGGERGVSDNGLSLLTAPSVVVEYGLDYSSGDEARLEYTVDFGREWLDQNLQDVGDYLNAVQDAGSSPALSDAIFNLLYQPDQSSYRSLLSQLSPEFYAQQTAQQVRSNQAFAQHLFSCKQVGGDYRFSKEGTCAWVQGDVETFHYDGSGDYRRSEFDIDRFSAGYQYTSENNVSLGIGSSSESVSGSGANGAWNSDTDIRQIGVALKYQRDAWKVSSALTYADVQSDVSRAFNVVDSQVARSSRDAEIISGLVKGSYDFVQASSYIRPAMSFGYSQWKGDSYEEREGGALGLILDDQTEDFIWLQPSVELGYEFVRPGGNTYRIRGNLGYQHYLQGNEAAVEASYVGAPADVRSMEVTIDVGQDMLIGELGLEMFFRNSVTLQFMWNYRQADNMDQAGGQVRLSKHF